MDFTSTVMSFTLQAIHYKFYNYISVDVFYHCSLEFYIQAIHYKFYNYISVYVFNQYSLEFYITSHSLQSLQLYLKKCVLPVHSWVVH